VLIRRRDLRAFGPFVRVFNARPRQPHLLSRTWLLLRACAYPAVTPIASAEATLIHILVMTVVLAGKSPFKASSPVAVAPGDDLAFRAASLDRAPWANANPVRKIFREACARARLPYFNPHSLRNTLVQIAYERKLDAEAFKAWSQNLGHESCLTTFSSYGTIPPMRQAEIIRRLGEHETSRAVVANAEMLRRLADQMEHGADGRA
jgi:hypothetical protein